MKIIGIIIMVAAVGAVVFFTQKSEDKDAGTPATTEQVTQQKDQTQGAPKVEAITFSNPKKSAHYESNTPNHGAILAGAPLNIVLDFNFDLVAPSAISIQRDGKEYGVGETIIDSNKSSMRRDFDHDAPDGIYKVSYNACWPDRSCHDGFFEFAIDRSKNSSYQDWRGKTEVTVRMSEISFQPMDIAVSAGTKITWINDDAVEHYVNTDSHPAHSYYPDQNSQALQKGDTYAIILEKPGIYPYHCSAHASSMIGNIIVE